MNFYDAFLPSQSWDMAEPSDKNKTLRFEFNFPSQKITGPLRQKRVLTKAFEAWHPVSAFTHDDLYEKNLGERRAEPKSCVHGERKSHLALFHSLHLHPKIWHNMQSNLLRTTRIL